MASRISWTAIEDATSPAACPPIPSATRNRRSFLSMRKLSSLCVRCRPISVAAANVRSITHSGNTRPVDGQTASAAGRGAAPEDAWGQLGLDQLLDDLRLAQA